MSDRRVTDETVEKAVHAVEVKFGTGQRTYFTSVVTTALLAVGLPALLERVEAAEERERDLLRSIQQAYIERKEHVALAAKVADALANHTHADTCDSVLSPAENHPCDCWRAALTEGTER